MEAKLTSNVPWKEIDREFDKATLAAAHLLLNPLFAGSP